jgi:L-threonylcarbamoyladenylate synthase
MVVIYKILGSKILVNRLKRGEVGVIPTDTLYGLVGSALNPATVERIYKLRRRDTKKPMIILISSIEDLAKFGIRLNKQSKAFLETYWPGAVSVVLPCHSKKFAYLHRGGKTLAFRFPKYPSLLRLLRQTGPLVAPSANWAGEPSAEIIRTARKYFSEEIEFYVDVGKLSGKPSTLVGLDKRGGWKVLREGSVSIKA